MPDEVVDRGNAPVSVGSVKRATYFGVMFTLNLGLCHLFHAQSAGACGETPVEAKPLLPLEGTTGAGLDIVLMSSSNVTEAAFALREVGPAAQDSAMNAGMPWPLPGSGVAAPDAGATTSPGDAGPPLTDLAEGDAEAAQREPQPVEFDTQCVRASMGGGAVCMARPVELLKPNTRYEWTVVAYWAEDEPAFVDAPWRTFTTGTHLTPSQRLGSFNVSLDGPTVFENHQCGIENTLLVKVDASEIHAPLVLNFAEIGPGFVTHAQTLTPDEPSTDVRLYNVPPCITPEVYDQTGKVHSLGELCLPTVLPPTDGNDDTADEPPEREEPGTSTSSEHDANDDTPSSPPSDRDPVSTSPASVNDAGTVSSPKDGNDGDHRRRGVDSPPRTGCTFTSPHDPTPRPPWLAAAIALVALRRFRGRR